MTDGSFTEGEKALIREISREIVDDIFDNKLPLVLKTFCCNNNCSAKRFFDDKENEKNLMKTIELVRNIQVDKKKRLDWLRWFVGGGIGLYAIKEIIGFLINRHR